MPTSDNYAENLFYGIKSLVVVWRMVGQFACSLTSSFFTLIAANHIWGGGGSNHVGWFYGTLHNWKYARLPKSAVVPRMGLAALYDIQQQYALFTRGSRFMIYNNNVHSSIGSVDFIIYTTTVCNVRTPTRDSRFSRNKNLQLTADAFWHYKIYLLLAFFSIQSRCKI